MTNKLTAAVRFPLARIVQGDIYNPDDTDIDGNKKVYPANHAKAGQPIYTYFFAIAIPKTRAVWWEEPWGALICELGSKAWPQGQWQAQTFAWKIQDGDSTTPNRKGRVNARTEGMPGCWIVNLSSSLAPKVWEIVNGGFVQLQQKDLVKCGYYVEVNANISSNERASNPGVYINHEHVVYRGGGPNDVISVSTPVSSLGFGAAALPAGVQANSLGGSAPTASPSPGTPSPGAPSPGVPAMGVPAMGTPAVPGVGAPAMGVPSPGVPAVGGSPAPVAVAPNAGFIAPPVAGAPSPGVPAVAGVPAPSLQPAAPAAPSVPAAPAAAYVCPAGAPAGFRMVNPAGPRYEAYKVANWNDAQLVTAGHMVRL